jgi:hypothetical protein
VDYLISVILGVASAASFVLGWMILVAPKRMIARGFVWPATLTTAVLQGISWIIFALGGFRLALGFWPLA